MVNDMNKLLLLLSIPFLLNACATGYRCDLGHDCTDAIEALELSKGDGGNSESVFVEPDTYPEHDENESSDSGSSTMNAVMKNLGMGHNQAKPVYIPDAPIRIWIAPEKYQSGDGAPIYLVDGYHLYGMVKGGWLLGNKISRNNISANSSGNFGMIGPLDTKRNLGFKPKFSGPNDSRPQSKLFQ